MPSGRRVHVPGPQVRLGDPVPDHAVSVPAAGEHTAQVLAALGYGQSELDELAADGVIGWTGDSAGREALR